MNTIAQQISPSAPDRLLTVLAESKPDPQRIAVSCIDEIDDPFPPPRPFDCRRNSRSFQGIAPLDNMKQADERCEGFLERASRRLRLVGYGLILASVLLLVFEGLFRSFFGI